MQRVPNESFVGRGVVLSAVLVVLMFAAIASALTLGQGAPALTSGNSECLLGTYTAEKGAVVNDPVTGTKQEVLVGVTLSVVKVKDGEFLVTASTTLTPQGSGKVTIMFTPPLTDMVVVTDVGTYRWSQGKYFIQAIISKELPTTSKVEMKVKGECVRAVTVEVRPLRMTITFGTGYPTETLPPNTVSGEAAGYVIVVSKNGSLKIFQLRKPVEGMVLENYVVRDITIPCNVTVGGILINSVTIKVYVPENLSERQVRVALQPLLAACTGNVSGLKGIAIVPPSENLRGVLGSIYTLVKAPHTSSTSTFTATITTKLTVVTPATVTATAVATYAQGTSTPRTYPTVPTTSPQHASSTGLSAPPGAATSATSTSPTATIPSRVVATAIALGTAFLAGVVVYLIVIRRT